MKKLLSWFLPLFIGVGCILFYIGHGNLLDYLLKPYLEAVLTRELNLKVTIKKINLSLLRARLNIHDIDIIDSANPEASKTHIHIPRIGASIQIRQLFLGQIALSKAVFEKPSLEIYLKSSKEKTPKKSRLSIPWTPIFSFDFHEIKIVDAFLHFKNNDIEAKSTSLTLQINSQKNKKYFLKLLSKPLDAVYKTTSFGIESLSVEGLITPALKINGKLELQGTRVQRHTFKTLSSSFSLSSTSLDISNFLFISDFGDLNASASFKLGAQYKIESASLLINDVPFMIKALASDTKQFHFSSENFDLEKIFTKKYKLKGKGLLEGDVLSGFSQFNFRSSLKDVFFENTFLGNMDASSSLKNDLLTTKINFKHPTRLAQGIIEASLDLKNSLHGSLTMEVKDFNIAQEHFSSLSIPLIFLNNTISIRKSRLQKKAGFLEIEGEYKNAQLTLLAESQNLRLEEFDSLPSFLRGPLKLKLMVGGFLNNPSGHLYVDVPDASLNGEKVGPSSFKAELKNHLLTLSASLFDKQLLSSGQLTLDSSFSYQLTSTFVHFDLGHYLQLRQKKIFDIKILSSGSLNVKGQLMPSKLNTASLKISELNLTGSNTSYTLANPLLLEIKNNTLKLFPTTLLSQNTKLLIQGEKDAQENISFSLEGPFNLQLLQILVPHLEKSEGEAKVFVRIQGKTTAPLFSGNLLITDGKLKTMWFSAPLENISSNVSFSQNKVSIDKFKGFLGGGDFDLSGDVLFVSNKNPLLDLHVSLNHVHMQYPDWINSTSSGELFVRGDHLPYQFTGKILIHEALYKENINWQSQIISLRKSRYLPKIQDIEKPIFEFNIALEAPKNIFVKNNLAHLETKGSLRIIGTSTLPNVLGDIDLISGTAQFKGNDFSLTFINMHFDNPVEINPRFLINAETSVKEYKISLGVDGTLAEYNIHLSSQPSLPEADIFSLLALGSTRAEIEKHGTLDVASSELGSLFLGGVQEKFQAATKKSLGVTFRLSPSYSDTKHATVPRIFIAKELGRKIDTTFTSTLDKTSIFADKEFNLKFNINKNLSILGLWEDLSDEELQDNSSLGVDLKAQFEFR
ncbi:MAG: hypothetical protein A2Z91_04235 [Deltaproteobacteria bacterium GWA2_38_16]|nr:MAG: hypothetical protein A2Z91_04235 [Deltaproteobacteria bacterium GWA2_38_16]OGQ01786.1 MAG: hypothetical protein A3D19_07945 [Deltaproteobacteria bacterium RIFCSPHIGHO2_02_FULL_38_15]OGQ58886.1 MAG: hypothetical protein A3G92_07765 [Deltaproteobacteria bacterium RIFCSPLOWO2_12_FULL_38_8]HBQ21406.1 hypothetical protein [Deltaproteobacteria bacterium]